MSGSIFDDDEDDDIFSEPKKTNSTNAKLQNSNNSNNNNINNNSHNNDPKLEKSYDLFYVTTIQLYRCKSNNNKYDDMGMSGVAILCERNGNSFLLYCYKTKDQSIFTYKITKDFPLKYQELNGNLYAELTMKEQQWSIRFPTISMAEQFAIHMGYAIFSIGDRGSLFIHDFFIGSGTEEMQNGDTLGIWWNCFTIDTTASNFKLVEHSTNKTTRALKRYTIGQPNTTWEKGTIGMRKGGKRVIICPDKMGIFLYMVEVERTKRNRKSQSISKLSQKSDTSSSKEAEILSPTVKEEAQLIELTEETTTKLNPLDPYEKILQLNQVMMETIKTELSSKLPMVQNLTQTLQKTQSDLDNTTLELTNEKHQSNTLKSRIIQLETTQSEFTEQNQQLHTTIASLKEELHNLQTKNEEQAQLIINYSQKEEEYKRIVQPPLNKMDSHQLDTLAKKYVEKLNEIHLAISLQKKVEEEARLCIICCVQERHYVCVPCGHLVYCENCSTLADKALCPICRSQVSLLTKIFKV